MWRTTSGGRRGGVSGEFQSTSPVWRTTSIQYTYILRAVDFNPRPPCGGRHSCTAKTQTEKKFQSTSPVWRTTPVVFIVGRLEFISIHVPRVEDDLREYGEEAVATDFNPRPPCGGRRIITAHSPSFPKFQSTSPVWRTTGVPFMLIARSFISIHVPRVEDDLTQF